jgi:hypothetical protein
MKPKLLICVLTLSLFSCTDTARARLGSMGSKCKIEVLSGGQVVRTYSSTGGIDRKAGGYLFVDAATGKLVEVGGEVIITRLD